MFDSNLNQSQMKYFDFDFFAEGACLELIAKYPTQFRIRMFHIDLDCVHDSKIFLFLVSLFSCHPMMCQYSIELLESTDSPDALLLRSVMILKLK